MSLHNSNIIDAMGIHTVTGKVVLTIADDWDWRDERAHLLALQAKLDAYFDFIEYGQIWEENPDAVGKTVVIDVIGRFPMAQSGVDLLRHASNTSADLNVEITAHHYPGSLE